ncbi:MAG TPA: DJ-1/PfpI family protein [Stellaceae bacterium]|nr:DJ-1/PfpI family protein [Stellaceae bacterium]
MANAVTIVFPLYQGVTQLDFTGPLQFVSRVPGAKVIVASVGGQPVKADGMSFADLAALEGVERCDVLCVPGGFGCTDAMEDEVYMSAIKRLAASARYVTSVCTGSLVLAAAGLLKGKRAACHWAWRDMLSAFGAIPDPARVVRDGNILTGGGVTAGIDFALTLIAEIAGERVAETLQLGLEYAPAPPFDAGTPETASQEVMEAYMSRFRQSLAARREAVLATAAKLGKAA